MLKASRAGPVAAPHEIRSANPSVPEVTQLLADLLSHFLEEGLVPSRAGLAEYGLEGQTVEQQPTFNMRVGNSKNHLHRNVLVSDFLDSLVQSLAIGVCSDDDQVRQTITLPVEITQEFLEFPDYPAVPMGCGTPVESYRNAVFLCHSLDKRANNLLVRVVFYKELNLTHRSLPGGCAEIRVTPPVLR